MTWKNALYLQDPAATYAAVDDRFLIDTLFSEGIMNVAAGQGLAVQRPAGANMQVYVPPLDCIIDGDDAINQGAYLCRMTVAEYVDITAAPTTNPRVDLIVAEMIDSQYRTVSTTSPLGNRLRVIPGTPAASPVAPALPATAIRIASVAVAVNATSITTANITDLRTQSGSSGYGPQAPAMTTAQRNAISNPSVGYMIFNTTTGKQEVYGGVTLGWISGASVDVQTFPVSGTWTKPSGASVTLIDVIGAGGGAGGGANGNARGGGGGARLQRVMNAADLGSTESVTVGAGGLGSTLAGAFSTDGGRSSFGRHAVAGGGRSAADSTSGISNLTSAGGSWGDRRPSTLAAGYMAIAGAGMNTNGDSGNGPAEWGGGYGNTSSSQAAGGSEFGGGGGGFGMASATLANGHYGGSTGAYYDTATAGQLPLGAAPPAAVSSGAGTAGVPGIVVGGVGGGGSSGGYTSASGQRGGSGGDGGLPGGGGGGGGSGPGGYGKGGDGARGEVRVITLRF